MDAIILKTPEVTNLFATIINTIDSISNSIDKNTTPNQIFDDTLKTIECSLATFSRWTIIKKLNSFEFRLAELKTKLEQVCIEHNDILEHYEEVLENLIKMAEHYLNKDNGMYDKWRNVVEDITIAAIDLSIKELQILFVMLEEATSDSHEQFERNVREKISEFQRIHTVLKS